MQNSNGITIFDLNIDEQGKSHLAAIAQWANINAIVGFASIGVAVISSAINLYWYHNWSFSDILGSIFTLGITFLLNITLFNAAKNIKSGVELTKQAQFTFGLTKLAGYFKIVGILTIIALVIIFIALLFGLLMGAGSTF
jgi:hypothetical protein